MPEILIILPTYNESLNLPTLLRRLRDAVPDAAILVVDDNSPDGTGELADRLRADYRDLHVLHRPGRAGLGAAYRAAYDWALERGFSTLVQMDADGSHRPTDLPRMLMTADRYDVVVGSRWVAGGGVVNWPLRRMILSRAGSLYARIMLGLPFRDITGGFRVFSAHALRTIDTASVDSRGYCFQIEMLMRSHDAGLSIAEVPITFVEREFGESKMSGNIVSEALLAVTSWAWRRRTSPARQIPAEVAR